MNKINCHWHQSVKLLLITAFLTVLMISGWSSTEFIAVAEASSTGDRVTNISGEYQCSGECVVNADEGWKLLPVSGEKNTVQHLSLDIDNLFYQVDIDNDDFHEVEIGSLIGSTLRTSTVEVSDNKFPVLEEYLFDSDVAGNAQGFTKIVRNPSKENFKSCVVRCEKTSYGFRGCANK